MTLLVWHVALGGRVPAMVDGTGGAVGMEVEEGAPGGGATLVQHYIQGSNKHLFQLSVTSMLEI